MRTFPRSLKYRIAVAVAFFALVALLTSQPAPREQVGPLPGGAFLLNSGWRLDPVGRQMPRDPLPMSPARSPDGKYLLVLNGGFKPPSVSVFETASGRVTATVPVPDGWLGLAISPKGDTVYVGGGSKVAIFEFAFSGGVLTPARTFSPIPPAERGQRDFIGDVALTPDGRLLYAANLYRDTVLVVNPQSGMLIGKVKTGRRPYRILFHPDGKSFFVTHWADGTLGQYDTAGGSLIGQPVRVGAHASDMLWRDGGPDTATAATPETANTAAPPYTARIFVAAANTNNVFSLGVTAAKDISVVESINVAMTPRQPMGMTPSALGLSADGKRLFVACSDANAAAVVDISESRSRVEGFIPTGWYPTAVRALANGTLVVLNGKGSRSYPNAQDGPNPSKRFTPPHAGEPAVAPQYVGRIQTGTASWIDPFTVEQLNTWTAKALANSPYRDPKLDEPSPLPNIQHVIYIVKENRS